MCSARKLLLFMSRLLAVVDNDNENENDNDNGLMISGH
jgi:hypothetical protein